MELFQIVSVATPVDHDEILRLADGRQNAMPRAARIVHALPGAGDEGVLLLKAEVESNLRLVAEVADRLLVVSLLFLVSV